MNNPVEKLIEEARQYVTEDDVRVAYMNCKEDRPDPLIVEEIHIVEYSENLIGIVGPKIAKAELEECIKVVETLNPTVAEKLREVRGRP
jgi:hypothetical protein